MPKETVILFTLQTSGTASIWRILNILDQRQRITRGLGAEIYKYGLTTSFDLADMPREDHLVFANCPREIMPITANAGQRFLINFRDPRDRICNEYAWNMQHAKTPDEPQEDIDARAAGLRELGIDAWIRSVTKRPITADDYYQYFMDNVGRIPAEKRVVNSYARLCLDFDSFIDRCCSALDVELTSELRRAVEVERAGKLSENPAWIGHRWQGADIMPGRYKRELEPETIELLNRRYATVLRSMALHDPDYADLYLENIDGARSREQDAAPAVVPIVTAKPGIVAHSIVERPDIRIDHFRAAKKNDKLVFTFTERHNKDLDGPGFATKFLLKQGFDVVAIKTNRNAWYENLAAADLAEIERWLSWTQTPYRFRLGYGSGMGAHAAIRFSKALRFDRVLALSPLFDISQEWDKRCRIDLAGMSGDNVMFRVPGDDPSEDSESRISEACDYLIVTDPFCMDKHHIRRFRQIIPADRLRVLPLPFAGHATRAYMTHANLLDIAILSALDDGDASLITRKVRARRSQSSVHLLGLAEYCLRRGHVQWAQAINRRLLDMGDEPDYWLQNAKILEHLGRPDDALATIDRTLATADDDARSRLVKFRNGVLSRRSDTVIFYTTQTSAAGSIFRIMTEINQHNENGLERAERILGHELYMKGPSFKFDWKDLSATGLLVKANCPAEIRPIRDLGGQKFLVNFRDPRDRLCNEYAWQMVHPLHADEPQEHIDARAARVAELGIDRWIMTRLAGPLPEDDYFALFLRDIEDIPEEKRLINSYARLCLDFDSFIERTCALMDVPLTDHLRQVLEVERTDKLEQNSAWIGQRWKGSDTMPGRYKRELAPETIAFLSEKYAPVLRNMARFDSDYAHLYLENIPGQPARGENLEAPTVTT